MASTCTFFNGYEHYKNYMCFAPLLKQNKDQYIIIEYSKLYFDKFISEEYLDDICNLFNIEYIKEKNNYKLFVSDIEGFCNRKLFFMITRFLYDMYECHKLCNPNGNYGQMDLFHKFKKETNGDLDVQPAINYYIKEKKLCQI